MRLAITLALLLAAAAAPARGQITVVGSGVEEARARPGHAYSGTLLLRNAGAEAAEARLYLNDYAFQADGTTRYPAAGSLPRSNAAWVSFSPAHVRLAPGQEATVAYTVAVPAAEALSGTYWSLLMVEGVRPPDPAPAPGGRPRLAVEPTVRYGVQIATTVAAAGAAQVSFAGTRVWGGPEGKVLAFDVANPGEVAYRPELRVELFHADGRPAGTFASRRGLLYPGSSLRQEFQLGALPPGTYHALVVADTGGSEVFGAQYELKL